MSFRHYIALSYLGLYSIGHAEHLSYGPDLSPSPEHQRNGADIVSWIVQNTVNKKSIASRAETAILPRKHYTELFGRVLEVYKCMKRCHRKILTFAASDKETGTSQLDPVADGRLAGNDDDTAHACIDVRHEKHALF